MKPDEFEMTVKARVQNALLFSAEHPDAVVCLIRYTQKNFSPKFYDMELPEYNILIAKVAETIFHAGLEVRFVDFDSKLYETWRNRENVADLPKSRASFASFLGQNAAVLSDKCYLGHHLEIGSKVFYLFDYGGEWEHDITVKKVVNAEPKDCHIEVLKITGEIPEQYPDEEDDE